MRYECAIACAASGNPGAVRQLVGSDVLTALAAATGEPAMLTGRTIAEGHPHVTPETGALVSLLRHNPALLSDPDADDSAPLSDNPAGRAKSSATKGGGGGGASSKQSGAAGSKGKRSSSTKGGGAVAGGDGDVSIVDRVADLLVADDLAGAIELLAADAGRAAGFSMAAAAVAERAAATAAAGTLASRYESADLVSAAAMGMLEAAGAASALPGTAAQPSGKKGDGGGSGRGGNAGKSQPPPDNFNAAAAVAEAAVELILARHRPLIAEAQVRPDPLPPMEEWSEDYVPPPLPPGPGDENDAAAAAAAGAKGGKADRKSKGSADSSKQQQQQQSKASSKKSSSKAGKKSADPGGEAEDKEAEEALRAELSQRRAAYIAQRALMCALRRRRAKRALARAVADEAPRLARICAAWSAALDDETDTDTGADAADADAAGADAADAADADAVAASQDPDLTAPESHWRWPGSMLEASHLDYEFIPGTDGYAAHTTEPSAPSGAESTRSARGHRLRLLARACTYAWRARSWGQVVEYAERLGVLAATAPAAAPARSWISLPPSRGVTAAAAREAAGPLLVAATALVEMLDDLAAGGVVSGLGADAAAGADEDTLLGADAFAADDTAAIQRTHSRRREIASRQSIAAETARLTGTAPDADGQRGNGNGNGTEKEDDDDDDDNDLFAHRRADVDLERVRDVLLAAVRALFLAGRYGQVIVLGADVNAVTSSRCIVELLPFLLESFRITGRDAATLESLWAETIRDRSDADQGLMEARMALRLFGARRGFGVDVATAG
jgi:hypothetical protein